MQRHLECVAIGDIHLGKMANVLQNQDHIGLQLSAVERALDYAVERGIRLVVQVGDVFDTPFPDQDTLVRLMRLLSREKYRGLLIVIILGNHDFHRQSLEASVEATDERSLITSQRITQFVTGFREMRHIRLVPKTASMTFGGVRCWFASWPATECPPDHHLAFGHMAVSGAKTDSGFAYQGGHKMSGRGPWWVLGDFHTHQADRRARYVYVGSTTQLTFGENEKKGFLHCRFDGRNLQWQLVPIAPPYRLVNVKVESVEDLEAVKPEPGTFYKLFMQRGVVAPQNWLNEHPEVVKTVGYRTPEDLTARTTGVLEVREDIARQLSPTYGLDAFLRKQGLDDKLMIRARRIMREVFQEMKGGAT